MKNINLFLKFSKKIVLALVFIFSLPSLAQDISKSFNYQEFLSKLQNPEDVPYTATSESELDRFAMLDQLGARFPGNSCSEVCKKDSDLTTKACDLGYFGGLYTLTYYQNATNRVDSKIWRIPNTSLNVEPYAYMKEMDADISCENSPFVKKFPTRNPDVGEAPAPITRVGVCQGWRDYFEAADATPKINKNKLIHLFWRAHTIALIHTYWNKKEFLKSSEAADVPKKEYKLWAGWSRVVGTFVPRLNPSPCANNAIPIAKRLMPQCIFGTVDENTGKKCSGEKIYALSEDSLSNLTVGLIQSFLAVKNVDTVIKSFEHVLPHNPEEEKLSDEFERIKFMLPHN